MDRSDLIGPRHIEPLLLSIKDNSYEGLCVPIKKGYTNINSKYKVLLLPHGWMNQELDHKIIVGL